MTLPAWMLILAITDGAIHIDCIELNHMHDHKSRYVFSQAILLNRDASDGKLHNVGWKILDRTDWPTRRAGGVHLHIDGTFYKAPMFRESWSQVDPERADSSRWWRGQQPNLFNREDRKVKVADDE